MLWKLKERMGQLQDAQKDAEVTSEATERELELEEIGRASCRERVCT